MKSVCTCCYFLHFFKPLCIKNFYNELFQSIFFATIFNDLYIHEVLSILLNDNYMISSKKYLVICLLLNNVFIKIMKDDHNFIVISNVFKFIEIFACIIYRGGHHFVFVK